MTWAHYILESPVFAVDVDISQDRAFAASFLSICSSRFDSLSAANRDELVQMLDKKSCIPTRSHGMKRPSETYVNVVRRLACHVY